MSNLIEKLIDKGFNMADIHFYMQRFGIQIWVAIPYMEPIFISVNDTKEEIARKEEQWKVEAERYYQKQAEPHKRAWEEAERAEQFEKHR